MSLYGVVESFPCLGSEVGPHQTLAGGTLVGDEAGNHDRLEDQEDQDHGCTLEWEGENEASWQQREVESHCADTDGEESVETWNERKTASENAMANASHAF